NLASVGYSLVFALENDVGDRINGKKFLGYQLATPELLPALARKKETKLGSVIDVPRVTECHDRRVINPGGAAHMDVKKPIGSHRVCSVSAGVEEESAGCGCVPVIGLLL